MGNGERETMAKQIYIKPDNDPGEVFEQHYTIKCPHCGVSSNVSAVSIPRYEYLARFKPERIGICFRCDKCNEPVFLTFKKYTAEYNGNNRFFCFQTVYEEVQKAEESFDLRRLPRDVAADFDEALKCYSQGCFNAFAAMCRRSIQSSATALGATGKDKVLAQVKDLKEMAQIDDETFDILKQITVDGHDGSHPHLPALSPDRAEILLQLMKDVLYQLFVRQRLLAEAAEKRKVQIQEKK